VLAAFPVAAKSHKAATQTPASNTAPAIAAPASVRLWKQDFASGRVIDVEVMPVKGSSSLLEFSIAKRGASFTEYASCPSGSAMVRVSDRRDASAPPFTFPLQLEPGAFVTLILRESKGVPDLQVVNDSAVGLEEGSAELTVRNFAPTLERIHVQSGDEFSVHFRAKDGCLSLRGLDRKLFQLDTTATAEDGKQSKWTTEVNFSKVRKATLLILADSYGRIRPRVVIDGQPPVTATVTAASSTTELSRSASP